MSRWARWTIGAVILIFGLEMMVYWPPGTHPLTETGFFLILGIIEIACFSKIGRPIAVRVIGAGVFFSYLAYFLYEFLDPITESYQGVGQEHWMNALFGLLLYGLPGLYVAGAGEYPHWGVHAKGFKGTHDKDKDENR